MKNHVRLLAAALLALALVLSAAAPAMASTTKNLDGYRYWTSLVGVTVIKHWSVTTFTYTGKALTTPKALSQSWWTCPPTFESSSGQGWDWYTTSASGTGRSNLWCVFVTGVPTPWGPIGSNLKDGHMGNVKYNGSDSMSYY
jgi:hypothetical protein